MEPVEKTGMTTDTLPPPKKKESQSSKVAQKALKPKTVKPKRIPHGQMTFKEVDGKLQMVKPKSQICPVGSWTPEEQKAIDRSKNI